MVGQGTSSCFFYPLGTATEEKEKLTTATHNILTIEKAKKLLRTRWHVSIFEESMEPGVAALLARHPGPLNLDSLKELSTEDAGDLSRHQGLLGLRDLSLISIETLHALVNHKGELILQGLRELREEQARIQTSNLLPNTP